MTSQNGSRPNAPTSETDSPSEHIVQPGDCISSIAFEHGFSWTTIWNHPLNKPLREKRQNSNVLLPGDVVVIPKKTERVESCQTENRHRFKLNGVPAKLRLRLIDHEDKPRANLSYTLSIDDRLITGVTDGSGLIEKPIPPNARKAVLSFKVDDLTQKYNLRLGYLDPEDNSNGIRQRLTNLGYGSVAAEGSPENTRAVIAAFQQKAGLDPTGEMNDATRQKLAEMHGV